MEEDRNYIYLLPNVCLQKGDEEARRQLEHQRNQVDEEFLFAALETVLVALLVLQPREVKFFHVNGRFTRVLVTDDGRATIVPMSDRPDVDAGLWFEVRQTGRERRGLPEFILQRTGGAWPEMRG